MKIALVCEHVDAGRGGAETSVGQFLGHLLRRGHGVELITRSRFADPYPGLSVRSLHPHSSLRGLRTVTFSRAADRCIAAIRPDLVHAITPCLSAHIYEPRGGTMPETVARNLAMKPSATARGFRRLANRFNLKQKSMLILERRLLSRPLPPRVIAISDYVAVQLRRDYGLGESVVFTSLNGVDPPVHDVYRRQSDRSRIRAQYNVREADVLVLLVAHNFKLKGVGCWIEAAGRLARLNGPHFMTLVVGRGNPGPYRRRCLKLGIPHRVIFAGPSKDLDAVYAAGDLLVHPTYYDPCSRVVLEGLLWGLPCLTTRYNGAAEAIEDGITGRIIGEPNDIPQLMAAAQELAAPSYRAAVAQRLPRLRRALSMERHADDIIRLYEELQARRGADKPLV